MRILTVSYRSGIFSALLFLSFFIIYSCDSQAQASFDLYGMAPISTISQSGGGGIGVMSEPFYIGRKRSRNHMEIRIGGDFYLSGLSGRSFKNVIIDPASYGPGTLKLQNTLLGLDTRMRLSGSYKRALIPYIDLFAGYSHFSSDLSYVSNDNKHSVSQPFYSSSPFSYGAAGGFMVSLGPNVKLDFGFGYTALNRAKIVDIHTAHMEINNMVASRMDLPYGMFTAKAGIDFMFDVDRSDFRNFDWVSLLLGGHSHGCHSRGSGGIIGAILR
ncbi:MAG: hypothetical protein JST26_15895 [Bacteroidetes bacterium]|nr:hypothetical protein [Bacteroidota bacterium]